MSATQPRVLMVFDSMFIGGTETHVYTLAQSLVSKGIHVTICAGPGPLQANFEKLGCRVETVPFLTATNRAKQAQVRKRVGQIMRRDRITHLHIHQVHAGQMIYPVARKLRLRIVLTIHGKYYPLPTVLTMKRRGMKVIAVSPPIRKWAKQAGVRSVTIPNGISRREHRPKTHGLQLIRNRLHLRSDHQVVVYAGRLAVDKSYIANRVIQACKNLEKQGYHRLILLIIGDGMLTQTVRNTAQQAEREVGRSFIRFLGPHKRLRPYYAIANCVVGTGRVALEAMACARPVVAIGSTGVFGRVSPRRLHAAWHYYFGDHATPYGHLSPRLERDIRHVLRSREVQRRYGEAGHKYVMSKFNSDAVASKIIKVYQHTQRTH